MKVSCYRQCELKSGDKVTVAWIDVNVAHIGWVITLEDMADYWLVTSVYDTILDQKQLTNLRKTQKEFESKLK